MNVLRFVCLCMCVYKSVCVCLLACLSIYGCIICKYMLVFCVEGEKEREILKDRYMIFKLLHDKFDINDQNYK